MQLLGPAEREGHYLCMHACKPAPSMWLACLRREISRLLKVNVMGYDYTGYGCSAGEVPSVGHTLSDVTAVYEYMVKVSGDDWVPSRWVLYEGPFSPQPSSPKGACQLLHGAMCLCSRAGDEAASKERYLVRAKCGHWADGKSRCIPHTPHSPQEGLT